MEKLIGNTQRGEKQAITLVRRKVRKELVRLIQEAKESDMQAAGYVRQALQLIGRCRQPKSTANPSIAHPARPSPGAHMLRLASTMTPLMHITPGS